MRINTDELSSGIKVTFHIEYRTGPEKKLCMAGSTAAPGEEPFTGVQEMHRRDNGLWTLQLTLPSSVRAVSYRYLLVDADGETVTEPWERPHRAVFDTSAAVYHLHDRWQETPPDITLYSSAFTEAVYARTAAAAQPPDNTRRTLVIRVPNPRTGKKQHLAIAGNQAALGCWLPEQAREMDGSDFPEWEIRLNADELTFPLEYKFLLRDGTGQAVRWETGENRRWHRFPSDAAVTVVLSCHPFREGLPPWKGAGTVLPVFSLRSEQSFGIGDLHDLKRLIDWAALTNQSLIQVLPVNDTTRTRTWDDSYPYSAISIYALHPLYVSLTEMGVLKDARKRAFYRRMQQALNAEEDVDYEAVAKYKTDCCRDFFAQEGAAVLAGAAFRLFWETERAWLEPYAAFCYYRDKYRTADFSTWGEHAAFRPDREHRLCAAGSEARPEIAFTCFLQFVLHTQFRDVADHARRKGIILKGDLPIGIHRSSVEAWTEPALFNPGGQAGAPPDAFSDRGQNWFFPTYNWDVMEKDDFAWWKKRLRALERDFTALRMDHILGFFRIWEIPIDCVDGLCGHFRPALPLTADEIEAWGLPFREAFLRARIHRRHAAELLGDMAAEVIETFLMPEGDEHFILKPFCNTQRKVNALFERSDAVSAKVRDALLTIACEVLFLADPFEPAKYHPRISASTSFACRELTPEEQQAFDRLSSHFFYERHNAFWKEVALKRLTPLVHATGMMICGEDLGMIPEPVHEVMSRLHILSLELERAPKTSGTEFACLQTLPPASVCTTSTHDMPPLRSWWQEDPERTRRYYRQALHGEGPAPAACTPGLAGQILRSHLNASSMLTVIPLQDWLAMSETLRHPRPERERINIPAHPHHRWRYRMHLSLETLLAADDFNRQIRTLIAESGRDTRRESAGNTGEVI